MAETEKPGVVRDFSKVVMTLENVLLPIEKLSPTPSMLDGLDSETEADLRILGCELIQTSGILLKLPQVAMATGQVIFQRFYFSKSFVRHNMEVLAMACINVASKIEESPRRIRDVINVFHHIRQVRSAKNISPLLLDQNYVSLKNQVIKAERRILKELGFCVHVKHPHKIVVTYLQVLECQTNQQLVQLAWNYMNDSLRTDVFVRHPPETIACACIFLAARNLQIPLPNNPAWFAVFLVEESEICDICRAILRLYTRRKPNVDELEKTVNDVKKTLAESKLKAKGISSAGATPNSSSRPTSPAKVSPSPLTLPDIKKIKSEDDKSDHSSLGGRDYNHVSKKRRGRSRSSSRSRSRTRSRSRSRARSYRSSSHSRSRSPIAKRRYLTPTKKSKKDSRHRDKYTYRDRDYKENREKYYDGYKDDYKYRDYYKDSHRDKDYKYSSKHHRSSPLTPERDRDRLRSYSRSPDRRLGHRKAHKEKSRKHNGRRRSRSRERERYRR